MLELKNISKIIDEHVILNNVSIVFPKQGFFGIKGKSGCGKSSLLYILSLIDKDFLGSLFFNGKLIDDPVRFRKEHISYMMQSVDYIEALTVKENIILSSCVSDYCYDYEKLNDISKKVGIVHLLNRFPRTLSGGQLKRMSIAKALLKDADIILCDEPTGALFSKQAHEIMSLLKEVSKEKLVIIVSHDQQLLDEYCECVMTLENGKLSGMHSFPLCFKEKKVMQKKKQSLLFYVLRQMCQQKYKYSVFIIFQWVLICLFLLLLSGLSGLFSMIEESEFYDVNKNIISVENKDHSRFDGMFDSYLDCDFSYMLEMLDTKTMSDKKIDVSYSFLPQDQAHIQLIRGTLPKYKDEVLVDEHLYNALNSDQFVIGCEGKFYTMKICGVIKSHLFHNNNAYISPLMKEDFQVLKDPYTLIIETKNPKEDYEKLQKDYIVYSEVVERTENYHTLIFFSKVVAVIFLGMSLMISLILYSIVSKIIWDLRKHDMCYLMTLGMDHHRLYRLTLIENIVIVIAIVSGGSFLYEIVFYYLNNVFDLYSLFYFELKRIVLYLSMYDLYVVLVVVYLVLCVLLNRKVVSYIQHLNVIETIRED